MLSLGQEVEAKITDIDEANQKISLSVRALLEGNKSDESDESDESEVTEEIEAAEATEEIPAETSEAAGDTADDQ